jgi:hypothetical protein
LLPDILGMLVQEERQREAKDGAKRDQRDLPRDRLAEPTEYPAKNRFTHKIPQRASFCRPRSKMAPPKVASNAEELVNGLLPRSHSARGRQTMSRRRKSCSLQDR